MVGLLGIAYVQLFIFPKNNYSQQKYHIT